VLISREESPGPLQRWPDAPFSLEPKEFKKLVG